MCTEFPASAQRAVNLEATPETAGTVERWEEWPYHACAYGALLVGRGTCQLPQQLVVLRQSLSSHDMTRGQAGGFGNAVQLGRTGGYRSGMVRNYDAQADS